MEIDESRHTGLWPFNLLGSAQNTTSSVEIFDPVALAFKASPIFTDVCWIGLDVMPSSFLYEVIDSKNAGKDVAALTASWVESNKERIATEYESRLGNYSIDELACRALKEALRSYRVGSYLSVVRTLMPEFERFGRMIERPDGSRPRNQKEAVKEIQDYISELPVKFYPPLESLAAYTLVSEELFASCFTEKDALALNNPNRHAELHGLTSYGDLRGATKVLSAADFLVSAINAANANNAGSESSSST
jgi:hypothetical protein